MPAFSRDPLWPEHRHPRTPPRIYPVPWLGELTPGAEADTGGLAPAAKRKPLEQVQKAAGRYLAKFLLVAEDKVQAFDFPGCSVWWEEAAPGAGRAWQPHGEVTPVPSPTAGTGGQS